MDVKSKPLSILIFSFFILPNVCLANSVELFQVCGQTGSEAITGVNNTDLNNAADNCLKIRSIVDPINHSTKWFTSTPSKETMAFLGYSADNSGNNSGKTYAEVSPWQPQFVQFSQAGRNVNFGGVNPGINGQFDRWCQDLSNREFAGRKNWRRPFVAELQALYSFEIQTMIFSI